MGKFKNWLKKSKILSNAAKLIPFAGPSISDSIENLGYGKRRGRRRARVARHQHRISLANFDPNGRYLGNGVSTGGKRVSFRTKSGKLVSFTTKKRRGAGFGSWLKKGFNSAKKLLTAENIKKGINKAKEINNTLKEKKYISNISGKVGDIANTLGFDKIGNIANNISTNASNYGYGKRHRRHRRRGGLRLKQNGGLKLAMNGGSQITLPKAKSITKVHTNKPILNGLSKPCGFNHKGLYNPQNSLQSFLSYKLTQ